MKLNMNCKCLIKKFCGDNDADHLMPLFHTAVSWQGTTKLFVE